MKKKPDVRHIQRVIREFKLLFPALKKVDFKVNVTRKPIVEKKDGVTYLISAQFLPAAGSYSKAYRKGIIDVTYSNCKGMSDFGDNLCHELLHGYFTKIGGISLFAEECLCISSGKLIYKLITKRLKERGHLKDREPETSEEYTEASSQILELSKSLK